MLVLTRKAGERIVIGENIVVTIVESRGDRVRIGIEAPQHVPVHREEVARRIEVEQDEDSAVSAPDESRFFVECA
jgi:carbon storage regulator